MMRKSPMVFDLVIPQYFKQKIFSIRCGSVNCPISSIDGTDGMTYPLKSEVKVTHEEDGSDGRGKSDSTGLHHKEGCRQ